MFAKVKQFVVDKAFWFAFMRYDRDNNNALNKDELTSMINDGFQLLRIPKQLSWLEMGFIMNMLDSDNNGQVTKDQAYGIFTNALEKFGGISGIAKFAGFGKTSKGVNNQENDQYAYIPKQEDSQAGQVELKISGKLNFVPPQDIDESMLQKLPPVGQNLPPQDLQTLNQKKNEQQQFGQQQQNQQFYQNQNQHQHQHGTHGGHHHGFNQQNQAWSTQQNSNNQQNAWQNQWGGQQQSFQNQQNPWNWSANNQNNGSGNNNLYK